MSDQAKVDKTRRNPVVGGAASIGADKETKGA